MSPDAYYRMHVLHSNIDGQLLDSLFEQEVGRSLTVHTMH